MQRKNIIVIVTPSTVETWGNFKKMCENKGLPYHSLKMKDFPISTNVDSKFSYTPCYGFVLLIRLLN